MVIVKIRELEKQTKMEKFLSNSHTTFDIVVDKKKVMTLHRGQEAELDLPVGQHTVRIQDVHLGGEKSNKLQVDVKTPDDNITIDVIDNTGQITASLVYGQIDMRYVSVKCDSCSGSNKILSGKTKQCEYCGNLLTAPLLAPLPVQQQAPPPIQQYATPPVQQYTPPPVEQQAPKIQKPKKPWYKKWWVWAIVFVVELMIFSQANYNSAGWVFLFFLITIVGFFVFKNFIYDKRNEGDIKKKTIIFSVVVLALVISIGIASTVGSGSSPSSKPLKNPIPNVMGVDYADAILLLENNGFTVIAIEADAETILQQGYDSYNRTVRKGQVFKVNDEIDPNYTDATYSNPNKDDSMNVTIYYAQEDYIFIEQVKEPEVIETDIVEEVLHAPEGQIGNPYIENGIRVITASVLREEAHFDLDRAKKWFSEKNMIITGTVKNKEHHVTEETYHEEGFLSTYTTATTYIEFNESVWLMISHENEYEFAVFNALNIGDTITLKGSCYQDGYLSRISLLEMIEPPIFEELREEVREAEIAKEEYLKNPYQNPYLTEQGKIEITAEQLIYEGDRDKKNAERWFFDKNVYITGKITREGDSSFFLNERVMVYTKSGFGAGFYNVGDIVTVCVEVSSICEELYNYRIQTRAIKISDDLALHLNLAEE